MGASKLPGSLHQVILMIILTLSSTGYGSATDMSPLEPEAGNQNYEDQSTNNGDIDLSAWHPDYLERCYFIDGENRQNSTIETIKNLLELISKEPRIGNHLISTARELGTVFCIDERDDDTRGYYDFKYNVICLKENLSFLEKLIIFVHELRHIVQFSRGFCKSLEYDIEEIIRINFAVEADVQAIVTLYAWRMREMNREDIWNTLTGFVKYLDISEEFDAEIQRSGNELIAARAAFIQWYKSYWRVDTYYKSSYSWYADMLDETKIVQKYKMLPENYFSKLCLLPCGNFDCHLTDEIKQKPRDIINNSDRHDQQFAEVEKLPLTWKNDR